MKKLLIVLLLILVLFISGCIEKYCTSGEIKFITPYEAKSKHYASNQGSKTEYSVEFEYKEVVYRFNIGRIDGSSYVKGLSEKSYTKQKITDDEFKDIYGDSIEITGHYNCSTKLGLFSFDNYVIYPIYTKNPEIVEEICNIKYFNNLDEKEIMSLTIDPWRIETWRPYCFIKSAEQVAVSDTDTAIKLCTLLKDDYHIGDCYKEVAWVLPKEKGIKICELISPELFSRVLCLKHWERLTINE